MLVNSKKKTVKMISGMGLYGKHSIFGANARHLIAKYELSIKNLTNEWKKLYSNQSNLVRVSEQIKELCNMRDSFNTCILPRSDAKCIIDMLCTE